MMANLTDGTSALKDDNLVSESNLINLDNYRSPVEQKIINLSENVKESLGGNDDFKSEIKFKVGSIIKEDQIKTSGEEIDDLAQTIAKELGRESDSEIKIEAKKIRIEIEKWKDTNSGDITNFKKEEFKKDFINEAKKLNPNLKAEELNQIKEYGQLVSNTLLNENILDNQKDVVLQANNSYSPGKLENSWTDLKSLTTFLTKKPEEIKEIKNKYENIKNGLNGVNLPNNRITRSFDNVLSGFDNQGISGLFSRTQNYLGWADRIDKLTGGWLNKTMSKVGGQLTGDFAKNSLGTLAEQGFQKGFSTILNGVLSGGVKAATSAGSAAVAGAEVAAGAAASATGIGAIVVAAMAVLKKIKEIGGKIAEKLGISLKKDLQEAFGKAGGAIINGAIFIVGLPVLLIGAVSAAIVAPILLLVLGGLFGYQMLMGNSISSLVPATNTTSISTSTSNESGAPVSGQVGKTVNGLQYSGTKILNTQITYVDVSKSVIGMDLYYGNTIITSTAVNVVIKDEIVELLKKVGIYIRSNSSVTNKVIMYAGIYNPSDSIAYPHSYALGIDLFNNYSYVNNGKTYRPYSSYGSSSGYRQFVCEVCNGNESCPQNINYHIYEEIFRPAGWCWGGYWGEKNFDPMHYEVLRPWSSSCSTKNKVQMSCN